MSTYDKQMHSVAEAWASYLNTVDDWQQLTAGIEPKPTGCGPVYEIENPIDRPNESFAIADMRNLRFAEPHYHPNEETEIYIVLQGFGLIVVGGREQKIQKRSVVITPPNTTHFTIPESGLVIAVINSPSFSPENYAPIAQTDPKVGFDEQQFIRLTQ